MKVVVNLLVPYSATVQLLTFQEYLCSMELTEENGKSRQFKSFPEIFM